MIYILTGNTEIGKSYALHKWIQDRSNVVGLISLNNDEGKRYFLNVRTKDTFMMHAEELESEENKIHVGRFSFLNSAFTKANDIIEEEANRSDFDYLIIDELGRLEIKQEGLFESTIGLIDKYEINPEKHLILVVRSYLLDLIMDLYKIKISKIINKDELFSI